MHDRPKSVKLFLQTHAGSKNGSAVYKNKVTPLFQAADVHVDCVGKFDKYLNFYINLLISSPHPHRRPHPQFSVMDLSCIDLGLVYCEYQRSFLS
jgi:hypothetical protein